MIKPEFVYFWEILLFNNQMGVDSDVMVQWELKGSIL